MAPAATRGPFRLGVLGEHGWLGERPSHPARAVELSPIRPMFDRAAVVLNWQAESVEAFTIDNGSVPTLLWKRDRWSLKHTVGGPPPNGQLSAGYDAVSGSVVLIDVTGLTQVMGVPTTSNGCD